MRNEQNLSLRSGFNQFVNNARQWGICTGTNIANFYNRSREIAHRKQPHRERGTKFIEGANTRLQTSTLTDADQRRAIDTWKRKSRKFTDTYNRGLEKADVMHDVAFA